MTAFVPPDELRARFSAAMSDMYRAEVPQYGALLALVREVNTVTLAADPALARQIEAGGGLDRLDGERHGAIRLGTAAELRLIASAFAVLGMAPVGYYDLAAAGVPVHSTAFRPIGQAALAASPFRVFTSLLRLELIEDAGLRAEAEAALSMRRIVIDEAIALIGRAEAVGGLTATEADRFVPALLETFRWHGQAEVEAEVYARLVESHRLVADVVSFRGPHINHLTPRVLDIDAAQALMQARGFAPKDVIEGPPRRVCPILLRQTSFKALEEPIAFRSGNRLVGGTHTARFGEIEQRGIALTRLGRAGYDAALAGERVAPLPDHWEALRREKLAFFRYRATGNIGAGMPLDAAIEHGAIEAVPIIYEDFLPVSAAGIFRSNLGDEVRGGYAGSGERAALEAALGRPILDEIALYAEIEASSIAALGLASA